MWQLGWLAQSVGSNELLLGKLPFLLPQKNSTCLFKVKDFFSTQIPSFQDFPSKNNLRIYLKKNNWLVVETKKNSLCSETLFVAPTGSPWKNRKYGYIHVCIYPKSPCSCLTAVDWTPNTIQYNKMEWNRIQDHTIQRTLYNMIWMI